MNSHKLRLRALIGTALLALSLTVVGATGAQAAKKVRVTGGTTTITPSTATTQFLTNNGIAVSALTPATLSNGVVTLPVASGRIDPANLHGFILHRGGLRFSKATKSFTLRRFLIVSTTRGAFLDASTPVRRCRTTLHARRGRGRGPVRICFVRGEAVRVARLSHVVVTGNSATADVLLSQKAAHFINRLAGSKVVSAGANLGTAQVTVTTA